ncbi:MAG: class I SAM-dependent methyltransferase [Spirochaetes bacterium]|nr:class I SAM-dependent methyltransferase [Spirochaetota bacterium]
MKKRNKGWKGTGMEGFFARFYDKTVRKSIMHQYSAWAEEITGLADRNSAVLEIAPGPGYLLIELFKAGFTNLKGADISRSFVEIARSNAAEAGAVIEFTHGNASDLQFQDNQFDLLLCTSAFKNFSEPVKALREMHRVLKKGGCLWLCDMRSDVSDADIDEYVEREMNISGLDAFLTKLTFKKTLRSRAYDQKAMMKLVSDTEFTIGEFRQNIFEFYIILKKQ